LPAIPTGPGIVAVGAVALGWLAAGRVLRPLSTITATARRISASSLRERLNLPGPDDELKDLGDTLDDLFARLETSFEAQRRFVANASHELRTPLTMIRTALDVATCNPHPTGQDVTILAARCGGDSTWPTGWWKGFSCLPARRTARSRAA
jgi:signal transduction histidine kinase